MKWLRALIVAALCLASISAAFAASAPHESPVLSTDKMATSFELFSITNAKVLHSDAEVQEAWWQSIQQVAISTATFQGPGDIVSGALIWGSVARVYNASLANTSTLMADLVDSTTGTVAVCTLRGSSTGFVDLTGSYCVGSLTPTAACLAAAGGACRVSKVYDQIGGLVGWVNTTNSQRPILTFSALNGLPGMTGTSAGNSNLMTVATFSQSLPLTLVVVANRTTGFTTINSWMGSSGGANNTCIGFTGTTAVAGISGNCAAFATQSASNSNFHSLIGTSDATNCVMNVDGTDGTPGACGAAAWSGNTSRIMRSSGGNSADGVGMEFGQWPALSSGQKTALSANIHSTSGYCAVNGCTLP